MKRYSLVTASLLSWLLLDGCLSYSPSPSRPPATGDTYRPIYASYADVRTVQTLTPQPLRSVGKIYEKDGYLYVNEVGRGIHVFDNRNPARPVQLSFISIPGNQEIAIKDSTLYADNITDLLALNIASPANVRLVKRVENAFPYSAYPLATNVRFECADPNRGAVVGWELAQVDNPQCYR